MKAVKVLGLALLGLVLVFFGMQRLGMPLTIVLGIAVIVALLLRRKLKTDPYVGWGYGRVAGVIAALASGAWAAIAFMSGSALLALVFAGLLVGAVLWIRYCSKRIAASIADAAGTAGASSGFQNILDQSQLGMQTLANNRRSAERGKAMHAQGENLALTRKNRELEAQVAGLKRQTSNLQDALEDPFYDPPASDRNAGA